MQQYIFIIMFGLLGISYLGRNNNKNNNNKNNESEIINFDNLTKQNIVNIFDKAEKSYPFQILQKSDNFPIYTIEKRWIQENDNNYQIFKITKNNTISYIAIDLKKFIGEGCSGRVYEGLNIMTGESVV